MSRNKKETSNKIAKSAAQTLRDSNASKLQKSLAGSALAQTNTNKQTGKQMEAKASRALKNPKSAEKTKQLAGSVVSQSNRKR